MNKQAFSYKFDELEILALAWESGVSPQLAAPFIRDGLLVANPPHYELTDEGRALLDHYGMYRPYEVQAAYRSQAWESKSRFLSEEDAMGFIVRLQAIQFLTPRAYRILDEQGRVLWTNELLNKPE